MNKAFQTILLAGVMAAALSACSSTGTTTDAGATSGTSGTSGTTATGAANPAISPITTPPAAVSSQIPPSSGQ